MHTPGLFQILHRPPVPIGQLRLTRLNIYSGLYLEWPRARVLIDPAKVPLQAAAAIDPDLILVSHESMDHFDPAYCATLLADPRRRLLGSWAVVLAFSDHLRPDDPRWKQILPAVERHRYEVGDLTVDVHQSIHCEYAAPVIFEITDRTSGFRVVDAIDTAITPEMSNGAIRPRPDLLIAPSGIALGVSADTAWQMTRQLDPVAVMASHFTRERAAFVAQAATRPSTTARVHAPDWHDSIVVDGGGDPQIAGDAGVRVTAPSHVFTEITAPTQAPPNSARLLDIAGATTDPDVLPHALYALSCALARGRTTPDVKGVLASVGDRVLGGNDERLMAAWLLAWGLCLRVSADATAADLDRVASLLSPDRPFLGYWVLECWGRASGNPQLAAAGQSRLAAAAANRALWDTVGIRRKLMWEIERLVRADAPWPGIAALLTRAMADANPDVRLIAFRILPIVEVPAPDRRALLREGLWDPHEDVLEEAIAAHIALFHTLTELERQTARDRRPLLEEGPTFQVRERANVLAEMLNAPVDQPAIAPPPSVLEAGVQT